MKYGNFTHKVNYIGCPESIHPFWISREPVMWPLCNLAASQRRLYCTSVNSYSPVGLVRRQWDANDWPCVLCDHPIQNAWARRSASSQQSARPFYSSRGGFFLAKHHITQVCQPPYSVDFVPCDFWLFPKLKSPKIGRWFVNAKVTQYTRSVNFRYFMSKNFHFQLLSFPKRNRKHMRSPCSIHVCISFNLLSQVNSFKEMGINIMPLHPHQEHNLQLPTVCKKTRTHAHAHLCTIWTSHIPLGETLGNVPETTRCQIVNHFLVHSKNTKKN
jgi:hypothetical protein